MVFSDNDDDDDDDDDDDFVMCGETNQFQFCKFFDKCYTCVFQDLSSKNKTYTSVNIWKTIISFISEGSSGIQSR